MLTVKNVLQSGCEDILTCHRVSFSPSHEIVGENGVAMVRTPIEVFADLDGKRGSIVVFTEGVVYVMNDNGKTVATYHLAYPEPNKDQGNQVAIG